MKIGPETIICINVYEWIKNKTNLQKHFFHFAQEGKRGYTNVDLLHKIGFKAGVSDILISKSNEFYKGLWIEVKDIGKKPTKVQLEFIHNMNEDGYFATWRDSQESIIELIKQFYSLNLYH